MSSSRAPAGERSLGAALADRAEEFVGALLGEPNFRTTTEWRYRTRGSLAVKLKGPKRGLFFDHEAGAGGDFVDLIAIVRGLPLADALRYAENWLGRARAAAPHRRPASLSLSSSAKAEDPRLPSSPRRMPQDATAHALALWRDCVPAPGTLVETYLRRRGLALPAGDGIRFHPRLSHTIARRQLPAMVALMRDVATDQPTGIHRTYLARGGEKANVQPAKMMLGRAAGSCVKLAPHADITYGLALAEGIETAIAATLIGWRSVWATLSAGALKNFPVLSGIESVTLFADHDRAGEEAARACATRWVRAGREVLLRTPSAADADWADMIKGLRT